MLVETMQKFIPQQLKNCLKPYFRVICPNKRVALLWITFRCTYKCSYCFYCGLCDYSEIFKKELEKSGEEWVEALEKLPPTAFYILGGEPFLFKDLPYILNNMPKKHSIMGIVTNASMPVEIYDKVEKKIHLNISFHREFVSEEDFVKKVMQLKDRFHVTVNIVATPENLNFILYFSEVCKKNKIALHVDPLLNKDGTDFEYSDEQLKLLSKFIPKDRSLKKKSTLKNLSYKKLCSAGRNYYNIMPNGEVSICSNTMDYLYSPIREHYDDKGFSLGNIFTGNFELNKKDFICNYKCSNHCDMDYCSIKILK